MEHWLQKSTSTDPVQTQVCKIYYIQSYQEDEVVTVNVKSTVHRNMPQKV